MNPGCLFQPRISREFMQIASPITSKDFCKL
jgi:hypothetical protein